VGEELRVAEFPQVLGAGVHVCPGGALAALGIPPPPSRVRCRKRGDAM
jgi:hypothetical protein